MLSIKKKDFFLRSKFNNLEKTQSLDKLVSINLSFKTFLSKKRTKNFAVSRLNRSKSLVSKVKVNRRCILTNRSRSVVRKYNLSQSTFQKISKRGWIFGSQKACW
jgi:ribosomal protein S14